MQIIELVYAEWFEEEGKKIETINVNLGNLL